jgi:hypothetical protein
MIDIKDYVKKGYKFMIIGAIGALVNLGFLYIFDHYLGIWYLWAEVLATLIAFAVNFNGNILVKNINIGKTAPKSSPPAASPSDVVKAEKAEDISRRAGNSPD